MAKARCFFAVFTVSLTLAAGHSLVYAQHGRAEDVPERARGSERVVVGQVLQTTAVEQTNVYGDVLIVSQALVRVEEAMKGASSGTIQIDVEGGTLDGVTMKASDMPMLETGQRAVFFVERGNSGHYVPHHRGNGILKLDARGLVENSSMTLAQVRTAVKGAGR